MPGLLTRLGAAGELAGGLLDLLYPPKCLVCGELAPPFCDACRAQVRPVATGGAPPPGLDDLRSAGYHDGALRSAVLRLKFSRKLALVEPLAELLAEELASSAWKPEALVPVPIHWSRRWQRGFNQSELLAEAVAPRTGIPVVSALRRTHAGAAQVGLSRARRAVNLRDAFATEPGVSVTGLRIVLIDDVRTTGATLAECARPLRQAGAAAVFGLTVTYDV